MSLVEYEFCKITWVGFFEKVFKFSFKFSISFSYFLFSVFISFKSDWINNNFEFDSFFGASSKSGNFFSLFSIFKSLLSYECKILMLFLFEFKSRIIFSFFAFWSLKFVISFLIFCIFISYLFFMFKYSSEFWIFSLRKINFSLFSNSSFNLFFSLFTISVLLFFWIVNFSISLFKLLISLFKCLKFSWKLIIK